MMSLKPSQSKKQKIKGKDLKKNEKLKG